MNLLCRLFGHRRSATEARRYSDIEWRSVCTRCRTPLIRLGPGEWIPTREYLAGGTETAERS